MFLKQTLRQKNAVVDVVGLGTFHLRENVVNFLSGPEAIVMHTFALTASAFTGTAPTFFLDFCV